MKTIVNTIPGYGVFEYALVLTPQEELAGRIMKIKEHFAEEYKTDSARWSKPHITLAHFVQYEMMEERILNRLKIVAMAQPAFKVELKDFGSFPSHTIFINVMSKLPVQGLVRNIRTETQRLMKLNDENKPHFMLEPYITIGRKLKPWQYEKGWLELSNKHFTGRFIADSLSVLKRPAGELKYHLIQKFSFQNLPVTTKQGELFA
jgi:2'-5' RNA ligase